MPKRYRLQTDTTKMERLDELFEQISPDPKIVAENKRILGNWAREVAYRNHPPTAERASFTFIPSLDNRTERK